MAETGTHAVNPALFDRLSVGGRVKVIYVRLPFLRSLRIEGMGSALAASTWFSRLHGESGGLQNALELGAVGLAILLAVLAVYKGYHALALPAAFAAAVVCIAILPFGFRVRHLLAGSEDPAAATRTHANRARHRPAGEGCEPDLVGG